MYKKENDIEYLKAEIKKKNRLIDEYHLTFRILNLQIAQLQHYKNRISNLHARIEYYRKVIDRLENIIPVKKFIKIVYFGIDRCVNILEKIFKKINCRQFIINEKNNFIIHYKFFENQQFNQSHLILIVAEVTLPQCYKYRVQQKKEYFEKLGWQCRIVDWRNQSEVLSVLQICKEVIFYRVPAFQNVLDQISEAKRLGLKTWWEVDDLIFDKKLYLQCGFMKYLPKEELDLLLFGSGLFRKALLACDHAIASTSSLAQNIRQVGVHEVKVIENALDQNTLRIASDLYPRKLEIDGDLKKKDEIIVLYGSGTKTHNADFLIAADGIISALIHEKKLRLWIIGELELPNQFEDFKNQICYFSFRSYDQYMKLLSHADIAIAPLEDIAFNDAKSNIKFLEASILGIVSVCSPRKNFKEIIRDGENGFIANSTSEWKEKICLLAGNSQLRQRLGRQAYYDILKDYSPDTILKKQVEPIFGIPNKQVRDKLKILVVNLYYAPYSYGGATMVAEEMSRRIQKKDNTEIAIFTSRPFSQHKGLRRYCDNGSLVYSVEISPQSYPSEEFNNTEIVDPFEMVLQAVQPDIVHFHAIQNLGLHLIASCQLKDIPYIITLHDTWWLCDRTFMVKNNHKYCFQEKIDLNICQACEPQVFYLRERMKMMKKSLEGASLLLSPSETHRQLYIVNDVDPDKIIVNRNGVSRPRKLRKKRMAGSVLRFGFVAGNEIIKGYNLIFDVFTSLKHENWKLTIVDSKSNLGYSSFDIDSWKGQDKVIIIPPYDENSKDDFFNEIDILLFPSQWKESYGLTVREALLRDVWVVCTHPGGQSEDVMDGINGTYISLYDGSEELKKVIEGFLEQPSFLDAYLNPYKDHIMTYEQQADELFEIYNSVKVAENKKHPVL